MTNSLMTRRNAILATGAAVISLAANGAASAGPLPALKAYRNPGCGCCEKWAASLVAAGFQIEMFDDPELDKRRAAAGVPAEIAGCHTAYVGNFIIEGHVPAADIIRFIAEKPEARGLAVVGMPVGSPGMEMDGTKEPFDVLLFTAQGKWQVYASH